MDIKEILKDAAMQNASDIFIVAGCPIAFKIDGSITYKQTEALKPDVTQKMIEDIYTISNHHNYTKFVESGDDDFSFSISGIGRFRCNVYMQRNSQAAILRVVHFDLPNSESLHIPENIMNLSLAKKGLILVSGPAGSGKSTTLACLINAINETRNSHIITIEDPIEFLHRHKKSIVSQREINNDSKSYIQALRAALRQAPEVILVGEMRDLETIDTAVTAAETGHLILSTLHTIGAVNTIDRIIDVFPPLQQQQIRIQLSMVLHAVVSQQLIPAIDGGMIPAFEIMICNNAVRSQIRDAKTHQIENTIYTSKSSGMITMDESIFQLYCDHKITAENAILYSINQDSMKQKLASVKS